MVHLNLANLYETAPISHHTKITPEVSQVTKGHIDASLKYL